MDRACVAPTGEIVAHSVTQEDELIAFTCDMDLGKEIKKIDSTLPITAASNTTD